MKYTPKNLEETQQIAADFVSRLMSRANTATVIGLSGDLGAGKTSFTQGLARALGVEETVVSPTFVIEKIYELPKQINQTDTMKHGFTHLIHIDAYRLEKSSELVSLGWNEIIADPHNLILVEWPERVMDIMPPHITITFGHVSENEREIEIVE